MKDEEDRRLLTATVACEAADVIEDLSVEKFNTLFEAIRELGRAVNAEELAGVEKRKASFTISQILCGDDEETS